MLRSLLRILAPAFFLALVSLARGAEPVVELLWPQGAPGAVGQEDADKPTLSIWKPAADKWNGSAIVICPGGGYQHLAVDHEGKQVAEFLNSHGVTAIMLKYRLAPRYRQPAPMQDVQHALRTVRARADEWKIDPKRVGVLGFSAGGHLASTAATHFDNGNPQGDAIAKQSCRPDFAVLCYPVITFSDPYTHGGSRKNLLGDNPSADLVKFYSNELQVTEQTPPTFLFHTNEDSGVVPENSILFYSALRKAKVPAELHIYEKGAHGVGLAPKDPVLSSWGGRLADWLKVRGYLTKPKPVFDSPEKVTDPDFALQGEYTGEITTAEGKLKFGVQVIARGNGKFDAVGYAGGLPGDGWDSITKFPAKGEKSGDSVTFTGDQGAAAVIRNGVMTIKSASGDSLGELKKVNRQSPTLGANAPEGALVLFDGSSADAFEGGRMTADKLLQEGVTSKQKFQSGTLHLEFRTPYMPEDQGQARGNSGCYIQGRYELQILDSFGLEGKDNECGGIYSISAPSLNMCFPPLAWQTYDIDFTAATFDADGKQTKSGRVTIRHNGVVIHNNLELKKSTPGGVSTDGPQPGALHLQNHGNPVRFRNIWWVPKP
ncbi:MAG: family 16 glycoside hydrolase [Planctomycetaceae bacterium]|jgi:acetyl esterase/lipase